MTTAFLSALAAFGAYLALAVVVTALFLFLYMRSTPHDELGLIRERNAAAAIGLAGAVVGFTFVLANAIRISHGIGEMLVWGLVGLVVQIGGHWLASRLLPRLYQAIAEGDNAAAILQASFAIGLGLLSAASMTP